MTQIYVLTPLMKRTQLASSGLMTIKILLTVSTNSKLVHYAKWRLNCDMYLYEKQNVTCFACSVGKNKTNLKALTLCPLPSAIITILSLLVFPFDSPGCIDMNPHLCSTDKQKCCADTHNIQEMNRGCCSRSMPVWWSFVFLKHRWVVTLLALSVQ